VPPKSISYRSVAGGDPAQQWPVTDAVILECRGGRNKTFESIWLQLQQRRFVTAVRRSHEIFEAEGFESLTLSVRRSGDFTLTKIVLG
jgi:hypothetical protein